MNEGGKEKPKADRTREQYLRAMKALVNWAIGNGWMSVDVTANVEIDATSHQMRPFLQPEEVETFLNACRPAHRIRAGLIIETGLRAQEATHLRWSWIVQGLDRPTLQVPAFDEVTEFSSKWHQARPIPLSARAQELLEEAAVRWGGDGFVLHDRETPPNTNNWCRETHRACRKAGVTDVDTHGLRRTAGAIWLFSKIDIYTVSHLLGHESVTTTERAYGGIAHSMLASAMDLVDALVSFRQVGKKGRKLSVVATTPTTTPTDKSGD